MFFSEQAYKQLPKKIKVEIDKLYKRDKEIFRKKKKKLDVSLDVINFTIDSLTIFLEYNRKVSKKVRASMTEAIGNIPLTFFSVDELQVSKNVEDAIGPLLDIVDTHACEWINREKLVKETLKKLKKLKQKF